MQQQGYNVTKIWLNYCCKGNQLGSDTGSGLNPAYIANAADFIRRTAAHNVSSFSPSMPCPFKADTSRSPTSSAVSISTVSTSSCSFVSCHLLKALTYSRGSYQRMSNGKHPRVLPSKPRRKYAATESPGGVEANVKLWKDIVSGLIANKTPLEAVLAYQLKEELYYPTDYPPFSLTSGMVPAANGQIYDMSKPDDKTRLKEDGTNYLGNQVRAGIRQLDPGALLAVGFAQIVREGYSFVPFPALATSDYDFVDYHPTPGAPFTLAQYLDGINMQARGTKPVMHGEIGGTIASFPTEDQGSLALQQYQAEGCRSGFQGWLLWTWDTGVVDPAEYADFWSAVRGTGNIGATLSPNFRPDPCTAFSISAAQLSFDSTAQGSSQTQIITLVNDGTTTMTISSLSTSGDFSETDSCVGTLAAGSRCMINVRFSPVTAGARTGTLVINDDAAGAPHIVSLSGSATPKKARFQITSE